VTRVSIKKVGVVFGEVEMSSKFVKIVVYIPETDAESVREALGKAEAGSIGNCRYCSFGAKGIGRFLLGQGANPHIGTIGEIETVLEERIETICPCEKLKSAIAAMKAAHLYEEVAFDIYALEDPFE
jgi:hypothetical protein